MSDETYDLAEIAKQVMVNRGLRPEFSPEAVQQASKIQERTSWPEKSIDLRSMLWCSIDNDDSKDLDQLTYAEKDKQGRTIIWIAIADVDGLVFKNTAIDLDAQTNTTSVYTPAIIFPMLPKRLSTNLTSLNEDEDRTALVVKILINKQGEAEHSEIFQAIVHNHAKLTYNAVGGWLQAQMAIPEKVRKIQGLENSLRCQHEIAQVLKDRRHSLGALTLETPEVEAKVEGDDQIIINPPFHNVAHQLIEEFMIMANVTMAKHFEQAKIPSFRRVVRTPKRWDRIVEIAISLGEYLPEIPDSKALNAFLVKRKKLDPVSFPDLSLAVIKLLGRGEYVVETFQNAAIGHFGLALSDYTHSTAPNRRFPDLISQRQYKAFLNNEKKPYELQELRSLAAHCTAQEDAAMKVERHLNKSAEALLLSSQIGKVFKGIITGAGEKGTWIRVFRPPVEGKIIRGFQGLDVGDLVSVKLVDVDVPRGFIDFVRE